MRLLKLKIKNLASLKGEHLIDFEAIENESSLFAITGETGAGKSTILNAIGLVLFGRVYKSNITQHDLVTLGEKEGQIELLFQIKEKIYLSFWRVKIRKQNGELYATPQAPQRELYLVEGNEFTSQKNFTHKKVEELIGLDFDQFCKCVILNQGEFARFLASSFTERKEILEKLYPGEMLESLGRELKSQLDLIIKSKSDIEIELNTLKGDGPSANELYSQKECLLKKSQLLEDWLKHTESIDYHLVSLRNYHSKHLETKKKHLQMKEELSKETTIYNEHLNLVNKCEEAHTQINQQVQQRLPKLEALLKVEEALKSQLDQLTNKVQSFEKSQREINSSNQLLEVNLSKMAKWEIEEKNKAKLFHFPISQLISHKNSINEFVIIFGKLALIEQGLQANALHLKEKEVEGTKKSIEYKILQSQLLNIPVNLEQQVHEIESKKKEYQKAHEQQQMIQIKKQEHAIQINNLEKEKNENTDKIKKLNQSLLQSKEELIPLESTLKLQELIYAIEVCRLHPTTQNQCPVCETPINQSKWIELRSQINQIDKEKIKEKTNLIQKSIIRYEEELTFLLSRNKSIELDLVKTQLTIHELSSPTPLHTIDLKTINEDLAKLNKHIWEQEKLKSDKVKLEEDLIKSREIYLKLKNELQHKEQALFSIKEQLKQTLAPLRSLLNTEDLKELTRLKEDASYLPTYLEHQNLGEKLKQENTFLQQNLNKLQSESILIQAEVKLLNKKIATSKEILKNDLGDSSAIVLIRKLNLNLKESSESLAKQERELKTKSESMKLIQGQIFTLIEYLKDLDLQFTQELHTLRSISQVKLPFIKEELNTLIQTCQSLTIDLETPESLIIPITELSLKEKEYLKHEVGESKLELARVQERISSWEKRLDRIRMLELKQNELTNQLHRKMRLYEVLGKDELRTFVLSLVEENLILVTNEELQKLCQGRYEIIHHAGRMRLPEFYIMDKFKEGEMRKVSTLSGGETFMVSLAMALGLAEMTRGQAEIDTLFIDEGFGTLDQESLQDVIDMLNQIQNRGLMIGIISHVKALTQSLPINLHVAKNTDGTSSLSVIHN